MSNTKNISTTPLEEMPKVQRRILIIGFVWPEPKSSAAGTRVLQLIELFLKGNYKITFATACAKSDNAFDLKSIGVAVESIVLNDTSFDTFITKLNPNVVVFDRFMTEEQFGWRVAENCPKALKILDTEDLHGLRKGRQKAFKDKKPFDKTYLFNDVAHREIASIYRCDITLIISEAEMKILKTDFQINRTIIYYLPLLADLISEEEQNSSPKFNEREHFITIGNFLHEPNLQSVHYLKKTIWPLIREALPEAELHIYGAYVPQKINDLNNKKEGFLIKGFVDDVPKVMKAAKVCLAPLQFGAGLKGKLIDAMKNGTPSGMTTIAAEGLFDKAISGFIEDDAVLFAEKAIALYSKEALWKFGKHYGFACINKRFKKTKFEEKFLLKVEDLQDNLEANRLNNFTGKMLQHNKLQSTKYMSKWIEEKNLKAKK